MMNRDQRRAGGQVVSAPKLKDRTLYVLSRDVENPKPDRRTAEREVFAQPVLKAGTRLRATVHQRWSAGELAEQPADIRAALAAKNEYAQLEPASASFYGGYGDISERHSPQATNRKGEPKGPTLWELLTAPGVLVEVPPDDADDVYRAIRGRTHDGGMTIFAAIDRLVKQGKITLDDFAAALREDS